MSSRRVDRGAFTLLESMLVAGLMALISGGIYQLWSHSALVTSRLSSGGIQMQEIRLGVKKMLNELQEGLALFYPHPGAKTQAGVGFLNARGEVVVYYENASSDQSGKSIWRANLNSVSDSNITSQEEVIRDVSWFRATVLPAARGKEASCVNLDVCLFGESAGDATTGTYNVVTSVFLRGLQRDIPE